MNSPRHHLADNNPGPAEKQGRLIGGGVAVGFHLLLVCFLFTSGFKVIYPPPQEQAILISFIPEPKPVVPTAIPATEPRSPRPNPQEEVHLVQQSTHVEEVSTEARTQESTLGETGDVEVHEPPPPKPINERALFRSRDVGDSLAEQGSRRTSTEIQAGHTEGNTIEGNPNGQPSARLAGRSVLGSLPLPEYKANVGGVVVVRISVDQLGSVTNAQVDMTGTTVQEKTLWDAAIKAAYKAKFNNSAAAPVVQQGSITYVFVLK